MLARSKFVLDITNIIGRIHAGRDAWSLTSDHRRSWLFALHRVSHMNFARMHICVNTGSSVCMRKFVYDKGSSSRAYRVYVLNLPAASVLSVGVCENRDGWLVAWGFCG